MKIYPLCVSVIAILSPFFMGLSSVLGAELPPLPAFIPNAPDKTKAVASYTYGDVFSCIATAVRPEGHPIGNLYDQGNAKIKADWPGAKDATQVDAILNLILSAATPANKVDSKKALKDVQFILYFVMDLSDTVKTDAVVRVAGQQTDPLKKRLIADFAYDLFYDLYDPRLLRYIVEYVDDTEEFVIPQRQEGQFPQTVSVGGFIWGSVIQKLIEVGFEEGALPNATTNGAQLKNNFIAWMAAHMAEATQKCNAYKSRPSFRVNPPKRFCWSARP